MLKIIVFTSVMLLPVSAAAEQRLSNDGPAPYTRQCTGEARKLNAVACDEFDIEFEVFSEGLKRSVERERIREQLEFLRRPTEQFCTTNVVPNDVFNYGNTSFYTRCR